MFSLQSNKDRYAEMHIAQINDYFQILKLVWKLIWISKYSATLEIIRKKNVGLNKRNHKEGKEFANEPMTAMLNWDVLCCREFTTETFTEMVLR